MFVCYFFSMRKKRRNRQPSNHPHQLQCMWHCDDPLQVISGRVAHPNPQTSATLTDYVISCHFLCRPAWSVFASWFCRFADSRGTVLFCIIRLWFGLWGCTVVHTFSPLFLACDLSCLTSPLHHWRMDGWMLLLPLTLSP